MDMQLFDIILRIAQVVVLPFAAFLGKILFEQRRQMAQLERRITKAEACLENVPSEKVLHELALTLRAFGGDLKVAGEKIEGLGRIVERVERVVARHEDFLLNGGK